MEPTDADLLPFVRNAPLAVATRALFEHLFRPEHIDPWFRRTAVAQYDHELAFSALIELMAAVSFRRQKSVRSAYVSAGAGRWPVTLSAVYQKLQHVEPDVCAALVTDTASDLTALLALSGRPPASLLPGRRVMGVDGSHAAATDHRLKVLRGTTLAARPGQALVVRDYQTGLLGAMVPDEDAHRNEKALIPGLFRHIRAGDVWLGDRAFEAASLIAGLIDRGACFVLRRHARGPRWEATGPFGEAVITPEGNQVDECPAVIHLGPERVVAIRLVRVRLAKPTQDGDRELQIVTNLPVAEASAVRIAELYRDRWKLEGAFQVVEELMHGEIPSLGYPKAALFAMALSLVAYNVIATVKRFAATAMDVEGDEVSDHQVAVEVQTVTEGMMIAVPPARWQPLGYLGPVKLADWLTRAVAGLDPTKYRKTKRGSKKPALPRNGSSSHVATARLLQAKNKRTNEP